MILLITVLIILFACLTYKKLISYLYSVQVKSSIDGKYYTVRDIPGKQETADTLAIINQKIKVLFAFLKTKECKECSSNEHNINLLLDNYNMGSLSENIELQDTSFTINKQEINLCLATRDSHNKIYDINKLMYIVVHELSHVGCKSIGHTEEFKIFFQFLAKQSVKCGVLKYTDYSKNNEEYCGIQLTNNILD
jgi:hypothetical protein